MKGLIQGEYKRTYSFSFSYIAEYIAYERKYVLFAVHVFLMDQMLASPTEFVYSYPIEACKAHPLWDGEVFKKVIHQGKKQYLENGSNRKIIFCSVVIAEGNWTRN